MTLQVIKERTITLDAANIPDTLVDALCDCSISFRDYLDGYGGYGLVFDSVEDAIEFRLRYL